MTRFAKALTPISPRFLLTKFDFKVQILTFFKFTSYTFYFTRLYSCDSQLVNAIIEIITKDMITVMCLIHNVFFIISYPRSVIRLLQNVCLQRMYYTLFTKVADKPIIDMFNLKIGLKSKSP